jgi:hypothetical protein
MSDATGVTGGPDETWLEPFRRVLDDPRILRQGADKNAIYAVLRLHGPASYGHLRAVRCESCKGLWPCSTTTQVMEAEGVTL